MLQVKRGDITPPVMGRPDENVICIVSAYTLETSLRRGLIKD